MEENGGGGVLSGDVDIELGRGWVERFCLVVCTIALQFLWIFKLHPQQQQQQQQLVH